MNNKEKINKAFDNIISKKIEFKMTTTILIELMVESGDLEGELAFYSRIAEDIFKDFSFINYEEKEEFLELHKGLLTVYNNITNEG